MNSTSNITMSGDNTIFGVLYLTLAVLVMMSNGLILLVTLKSRELHLPTLWMIAFTALWDFFVGVYILLFAVPSSFLNHFAYPKNMISVSALMIGVINQQNIFNTDLLVFDRYLAVRLPLAYARIAVARNYALLVLLTLVVNLSVLLVLILTDTTFYFDVHVWFCMVQPSPVVKAIVGSELIISLLAMILGGVLVFKNIMQSRKRIALPGVNPTSQSSRRLSGFSLAVVISSAMFCLSYFPFALTAIFFEGQGHIALNRLSTISVLSNSVLNVFIYTTTYRPFRNELNRLFCKAYYRRQRQAAMMATFQHNELGIISRPD